MMNDKIEISVIVPVEKTGSDLIEFFKGNRFFRNFDTEVILVVPDQKSSNFCSKFIYNDYSQKAKIKIVKIESDSEIFIPKALNTGAMICKGSTVIFMSQSCHIYCEKWKTLSNEIERARKLWGNKFWFKPEIIKTLSRKDVALPQENQVDFLFNFWSHKEKIESKQNQNGKYWFDFFCMDKSQFLTHNGFSENPEWNFGSNNIEERIKGIRSRKLETEKIRGMYFGKPTYKSVPHKIENGIPVLRETSGEHPRSASVDPINKDRSYSLCKSWENNSSNTKALYHHIDQKLHDLIISEEYNDIDVLHIGFFFFNRHSLFKIVQNVVHHSKSTKQKWLCLQEHKIEDVFEFCNIVRPKIIHIHFADIIDESAFQFLRYKPKIIGTMHTEKLNPYHKSLDMLICISELTASMNRGTRKVIENTVWIDEDLVRKEIDDCPDFCLTARFSPFVLSKETIHIYSKIKSDVWIYGHTQDDRSRKLKSMALKYPNLNVMDWDNYVERMISKHSVFSIIKPVIDSSYQYDMNVMEAVALGMPCITTKKRQDHQEYVIDGYNGFQVSDSNEFISACNRMVESPELFGEMKKNALAHRKSIKNVMPEQYEEIYVSLI